MLATVHIHPRYEHQRKHGKALESGFKRHGIECDVTSDIKAPGDIHVVSGPYYAKPFWLNQKQRNPDIKVILLDRCYYKGDPEHISLGWMTEFGGREFVGGEGKKPVIPLTQGYFYEKTIYLADYNGEVEEADVIRYHPRNQPAERSLEMDLVDCGIAIGNKTSALVTAALMGLDVIARDPEHILNQEDWEYLLPWADWSHEEMANGDAWEHLKTCQR